MNRLALALLLLASMTAPAWPGIHAALHAYDADAIPHADAIEHSHDTHGHHAEAHLGTAGDSAHGHDHPELTSLIAARISVPAVVYGIPAPPTDLACAETIRLAAPDESPPARAGPERGTPDRPRGPPLV